MYHGYMGKYISITTNIFERLVSKSVFVIQDTVIEREKEDW